jgi:hypothetical protein
MTSTQLEKRCRVRQRAHEIWTEHLRPAGRDVEFWLAAERELDGQESIHSLNDTHEIYDYSLRIDQTSERRPTDRSGPAGHSDPITIISGGLPLTRRFSCHHPGGTGESGLLYGTE